VAFSLAFSSNTWYLLGQAMADVSAHALIGVDCSGIIFLSNSEAQKKSRRQSARRFRTYCLNYGQYSLPVWKAAVISWKVP
jgi:hypothetical protein